jgi:molecular chaperone DnaJ
LSTRDYYEVLGLARDADAEAIKTAFHRFARRYHPDRSSEPDTEERFKEVAEAYAVLSDPAKRADYDTGGAHGPAGYGTEDLLASIDLRDLLDAGLDLGGALFGRHFNIPDGSGAAMPTRGADVRTDIEVPLAAVATGTEAPVHFRRTQTCPTCRGSGAKPGTAPSLCRACRGSGQRTITGQRAQVLFRRTVTCEQCAGTGRVRSWWLAGCCWCGRTTTPTTK